MNLNFFKYHGTGNDFVLIDNRSLFFPAEDYKMIEKICHRRFGVGADGLILIQNHADFDFYMRYFNADGFESTMCGNGGRCTVAFARELGMIAKHNTTFMAIDGIHQAEIKEKIIRLKMIDITRIAEMKNYYFIDSGSPHLVILSENITDIDVVYEGRKLRYDKTISENGVNVNFIQQIDQENFRIRTYERGVEDETLSCGTGSVAAAIAYSLINNNQSAQQHYRVHTLGGLLEVDFKKTPDRFTNIYLSGPAEKVFEGKIEL